MKKATETGGRNIIDIMLYIIGQICMNICLHTTFIIPQDNQKVKCFARNFPKTAAQTGTPKSVTVFL